MIKKYKFSGGRLYWGQFLRLKPNVKSLKAIPLLMHNTMVRMFRFNQKRSIPHNLAAYWITCTR